jgi:predicted  nucleic acid-binding Zn-ribbon protein
MPHQCVRCAKLYPEGCQELLKGCNCGGKFFFFVKQESLLKAKELTKMLSKTEKEQMEKDVLELVGDLDPLDPIILDFESINIKKPGHYEIDLIDLFKGKPLIYKLDEGKYIIDIVSTFEAKNS